MSARRVNYWPITDYLRRAEVRLAVIGWFNADLAREMRDFFQCGIKKKLSRRAARRIKREHNQRLAGAAAAYSCGLCGLHHVHSVMEPIDLLRELHNRGELPIT